MKGGMHPAGIGIGIALGVGLGVAIDNLAAGLGIGVALGVGIGIALGAALKKKRDDSDQPPQTLQSAPSLPPASDAACSRTGSAVSTDHVTTLVQALAASATLPR